LDGLGRRTRSQGRSVFGSGVPVLERSALRAGHPPQLPNEASIAQSTAHLARTFGNRAMPISSASLFESLGTGASNGFGRPLRIGRADLADCSHDRRFLDGPDRADAVSRVMS